MPKRVFSDGSWWYLKEGRTKIIAGKTAYLYETRDGFQVWWTYEQATS
jgi:hypothetical protein